jgi:hypothetical protein
MERIDAMQDNRAKFVSVSWDVLNVKKNHGLYQKIAALIALYTVKDTDSCCIMLIGHVDDFRTMMDEYAGKGIVRYKLRKLAPEDDSIHEQDVRAGFERMLSNVGNSIKRELKKLEDAGKAPQLTKGQARGLRKDMKNIRAAQAVFGVTDDLQGMTDLYGKMVADACYGAGVNPVGGRFKSTDAIFGDDNDE